jgi:D-alanyl-lipoteichoic acid acyltransferase DltB (MBOAT superfamily)
MIFSAPIFLFLFLPGAVLGFYLFGRIRTQWAFLWLIGASLFFYAWWNPPYVIVLLCSIIANYLLSRILFRATKFRTTILGVSIALNVAVLGYFKYMHFFAETLSTLGLWRGDLPAILLPLGISFITFQKIAFLVDTYRGETGNYSFLEFCLFVTFFPQLIAGPIVHHRDVIPQFKERELIVPRSDDFAIGITIFLMGLGKKVLLADSVGVFVDPVFHAAEASHITFLEAWGSALAYTFQLYFDFSGYADMAIGAAKMFGITLPVNFDSPYKSKSIIEFWRRWHITLSRFLREYIYIPLGGNRQGWGPQMTNLFITMVIAGIWHGAGWTFALWGILHGLYLVVNHAWRRWQKTTPEKSRRHGLPLISWLVTFLAIVGGWVIFRAESLHGAFSLLKSMMGLNGFALPSFIPPPYSNFLTAHGFAINLESLMVIGPGKWVYGAVLILLLSFIAFFLPNTREFMGKHFSVSTESMHPKKALLLWKPSIGYALCFAVLSAATLTAILLAEPREFLYFQF